MQCPICNSEISQAADTCDQCGATRTHVRTSIGVFAGWVGIVVLLMWLIMALPLLLFPFIHLSLAGYPWIVLVIGLVITAGMFWYSKSTVHAEWVKGLQL